MKNSISVSTEFDFRGKTLRPAVTLDLDGLMERGGEMPDYHQLLAKENGIGFYSYEYEVLESSELFFSSATGLAASFLDNGVFDFDGFSRCWREKTEMQALEGIARRYLDVETLEQEPKLREALMEAYRLGKGA